MKRMVLFMAVMFNASGIFSCLRWSRSNEACRRRWSKVTRAIVVESCLAEKP